MNGMYEIEYHFYRTNETVSEIVTVDGRSQRQNRTPQCLIDHAEKQAANTYADRYRIHRVKLRHITASTTTSMVTSLVYENELDHQDAIAESERDNAFLTF